MIYRAIIFDNDGVLADTEGAAAEHDPIFLSHFGYKYDLQDYALIMEGKSSKDFEIALRSDWLVKTGGTPLPDNIMELLRDQHQWQRENIVLPVKDVIPMVQAINATGIKKAVASNGEMDTLIQKMQRVGVYDSFAPHVYNKDHVNGHGKPAPDLFLYAMQQLGITNPAECIAIGDTALDMQAGRAAGMYTIGYSGGQHRLPGYGKKLYDNGADVTFDNMSDMQLFILNMLKPAKPKPAATPAPAAPSP